MTKRKWLWGAGLLVLAGGAFFTRGYWMADKSNAQAPAAQGGRVVVVEVASQKGAGAA